MAKPKSLDGTVRAIRACFNRLKLVGDQLHQDIGITAAMRGVMENLDDDGPQTVPDIARTKQVSRQHIQILADQLAEAGMASFKDNPAHKRSSLLSLTAKGTRTFTAMKKKEVEVLGDLARDLSERDLALTLRTLNHLQDSLDQMLNRC